MLPFLTFEAIDKYRIKKILECKLTALEFVFDQRFEPLVGNLTLIWLELVLQSESGTLDAAVFNEGVNKVIG